MPETKKPEERPEYCPLQDVGCKKVQEAVGDVGEASKELKKHGEAIIRIEEHVGTIDKNVGDIKKALMGNGREGLIERVKSVEGKSKFLMWFSYLLIGSTLTAIVIVLVNHLTKA